MSTIAFSPVEERAWIQEELDLARSKVAEAGSAMDEWAARRNLALVDVLRLEAALRDLES